MIHRRIGLLQMALVLVWALCATSRGQDAEIPADWWTHHDAPLPEGMSVFEGRLYWLGNGRIYFRWIDCQLTDETQVYAINHQSGSDPALFDGRRLSVEEFAELVWSERASTALTIYGKPTVDRRMRATRIEFGTADLGPDEWFWGNRANFGFVSTNARGRYLGTWRSQMPLAATVGDENGNPLIAA